jgi:N-acetylglucosaminyl-diphospho-decaprenol L-rhamnosyltransferase
VDPRVTIVIASKDRREELLGNLPRHLDLPEAPRVILVDDASTDESADAVEAQFPQVEVIRLEESRGGAARNVGTARAATPYVAYCDDDSWFDPGALTTAADLLDANPRLAVVNGRVLVGPEERDDPLNEEMAGSPLPREDGQPGHPLLSFIACAIVVRRDAVLAAGGFPDRFGVGGEEEILGWDLATAGWLMSYVPEVVAHHHPPKHAGRPERRVRGLRNTLWTTWLRRPLRASVVRTARQLIRLDWDRYTVRGVAEAVAGLPWVVRERKVSPPHIEARRRMLEDEQLGSRRYV